MLIGVEVCILRLYRMHIVLVKEGNELLMNQLDTRPQAINILRLLHSLLRTLKVVHQCQHLRKDFLAGSLH